MNQLRDNCADGEEKARMWETERSNAEQRLEKMTREKEALTCVAREAVAES